MHCFVFTRPNISQGLSNTLFGPMDFACFLQATDQASVHVQQVAVRFLGNWAEASVMNCGKIASMHGGQALTQIAAAAASAGHNRQLEYELVRSMALLARDCPLRQSLGVDKWLRQLLYIAADAAAMKHWKLASQVCIRLHAYYDLNLAVMPQPVDICIGYHTCKCC